MKIAPSIFLNASYPDRAAYKAGVNLEQSKIFLPPQTVCALVIDYAKSTLSQWDKEKTRLQLVNYSVYLSFTAQYDDGREAQRAYQHTAFKQSAQAVKHVEERASEFLKELKEIGEISMERETKVDGTSPEFDWVTARCQCSLKHEFERLKKITDGALPASARLRLKGRNVP